MLLAHRVTALQIPFGRTDLLEEGLAGRLADDDGGHQPNTVRLHLLERRAIEKVPMLDAVDAQVDGR